MRSLRSKKKRIKFEALLTVENFDLVTITETWWTSNLTQGLTSFENYNVASRCDRSIPENSRAYGGGVAILVKKSLKYHSPIEFNIENHGQIAAVKVSDLQIIVVYRRPEIDTELDKQLTEMIIAKFKSDNVVLMGDINIPDANWVSNIFPSSTAKLWEGLANEMDFDQHVHESTHDKGNALDLLFARSTGNDLVRRIEIDEIIFHSLTDHYAILADIKIVTCNDKHVKTKEIFNVKCMDWEAFSNEVKEKRIIPKVSSTEDVNVKLHIIIDAFSVAREIHCPKITITEGKAPRWISRNLQLELKKSQRMRKKAKLPASSIVKRRRIEKAKYHSKKVNIKVMKARIKFESDQIFSDKKNPRELFNQMKRAKSTRSNSPPINDASGNSILTDVDKCNAFQDKFISVFTPLDPEPINWTINWGLNHIEFTPKKVKLAIKNMKTNTSPGSDTFGPIYYKNCDLSVIFALCDLYQSSFDNTIMPTNFLVNKVIPLWKNKGSSADMKNYRQITLGNTPYKIKEKVILTEIDDHLHRHGLFDNWQHGFMRGRSTITNLMDTWEFLSKEVDLGKSWITLSLDFSSAFDTISIRHLMLALQKRGIGGRLGMFLEYWLKSRSQYIQIGDAKSRVEVCSSGVCQGSQTGPRFFGILLSDVYGSLYDEMEHLGIKLWCFADDSRLAFQSRNLQEASRIQEFLSVLNISIKAVGLKLNASKSIMVHFGNEKFRHDYHIDGTVIPVADESLELGCIISNSMNFNSQLRRNVKKALSLIFMIRNTFKVRNYLTLKRLYVIYYMPILTFSCQIWLNPSVGTRDMLYRMHRRFWYLGEGKIIPRKSEIMDPYQVSIKCCLVFLFQVLNAYTCLTPEDFFKLKEREITRSDRKNDIEIQRSYHIYRSNFFTTFISKLYNRLPVSTRKSKSLNIFKTEAVKFVKKEFPTPDYDYTPYYKRG